MKLISNLIILVATFFGVISCNNEDEVFEPVEFKTSGVDLIQSIGNVNSFYAELPSEGGVITFEATGKNKENGFLNYYKIDGVAHDVSKNTSETVIAQGDWGKIERISISPHTTRVTLNPNQSDKTRNVELFFGVAYKTSNILISVLRP